MKFSGFVKTSLIDYPDNLASVLYLPRCNFNCDFCHNSDLVNNYIADIEEELIFDHLRKRKNIIDAIVVTGGEPTLHEGLIPFLRKLKAMDIKVKLDTNGYKPKVLEEILKEDLVNYIAMDVKNTKDKYLTTISLKEMIFDNILDSVSLIKNSNVKYEFRTTLMKEYHTKFDINELSKMIGRVDKFVLQQYQYSQKQLKDRKFTFFTMDEMQEIKNELLSKKYIDKIDIRGKY